MTARLMTADQLPEHPKAPDLPKLEFSYKMYKNRPIDWETQKLNWVLFRKLD